DPASGPKTGETGSHDQVVRRRASPCHRRVGRVRGQHGRKDQEAQVTGAERFLSACHRGDVDVTPVWFMRQAGRCLAEYRELRESYDILTIAKTPELCA